MVAESLDLKMQKAYNVKGIVKEYIKLLEQVNPKVLFFIDNGIPCHTIIDTKENKIAKVLGENLAEYAKFKPALMDRVLTRIIDKH